MAEIGLTIFLTGISVALVGTIVMGFGFHADNKANAAALERARFSNSNLTS